MAGSGIKGKNQPYSVSPVSEWGKYYFDNPSKAFNGLPAPTPEKAELAGDTEADIAKWKTKYKDTGNVKYRVLEIYARYGKQLKTGSRPVRDFSRWLDMKLIGNEVNQRKGDGFEAKVVRDFKLVGPDWICQKEVTVKDPKTGESITRKYDAYNARTKEFVEFKSNGKHISKQLRHDKLVLRAPDYKDHKLRLITGEKTTPNTIRQFGRLNKQLESERGKTNQVTVREQRSTGLPRWKPNQYTRYDKVMNPDPQRVGSRGPMNDAAWRSGDTPEEARRLQQRYSKVNTRGAFGRGPGGVDFSTVELNYVGTPVKGEGLDYSFKADYVPDADANPGWGGEAKLQLASDAFFTWLALTPDKFWVNLNPDEPDRIMDDKFATTDAGRILLEADLQMKHDFYKVMDPDTDLGDRFWDSLPRENGLPCLHGMRNWIEPEPAKVREQDGGIYILDAPLKLSSVPAETITQGPGEPICNPTDEESERIQRVVDRLIVPEVEKIINTAPQYADLRRIYTSRVAAEWIRQQDAKKPTDFREIINSGDVKRWPLRGENADWDEQEIFDKYVKIFREGEFEYEMEYGGTVTTYIVGGVDFSKSPKRNITRTRFNLEHPRLDTTTETSMRTVTSYRDTETAYLGGNSAGQIDNGGGTDPTPIPTPTDTGKPTDPTSSPATPTPEPSATGPGTGDDTPGPTGEPKDPDGDLADTGTRIGIVAAVAAALLAAGGSLIWWRRRRNTAQS